MTVSKSLLTIGICVVLCACGGGGGSGNAGSGAGNTTSNPAPATPATTNGFALGAAFKAYLNTNLTRSYSLSGTATDGAGNSYPVSGGATVSIAAPVAVPNYINAAMSTPQTDWDVAQTVTVLMTTSTGVSASYVSATSSYYGSTTGDGLLNGMTFVNGNTGFVSGYTPMSQFVGPSGLPTSPSTVFTEFVGNASNATALGTTTLQWLVTPLSSTTANTSFIWNGWVNGVNTATWTDTYSVTTSGGIAYVNSQLSNYTTGGLTYNVLLTPN